MIDKNRDVYVQVRNVKDIAKIMSDIKKKQQNIKRMFYEYDSLDTQERKHFENWTNYIDDISTKIDNITL